MVSYTRRGGRSRSRVPPQPTSERVEAPAAPTETEAETGVKEEYDESGRLVSRIRWAPDDSAMKTTAIQAGGKSTTTTPLIVTREYLDTEGNVIRTQKGKGSITTEERTVQIAPKGWWGTSSRYYGQVGPTGEIEIASPETSMWTSKVAEQPVQGSRNLISMFNQQEVRQKNIEYGQGGDFTSLGPIETWTGEDTRQAVRGLGRTFGGMAVGSVFGAQAALLPEATPIVLTATSLFTLGNIFGKGGLRDVWTASSKEERVAIAEQIIVDVSTQMAGFDVGYNFAKAPALPEATKIWGEQKQGQKFEDYFAEDRAFTMKEQLAYQQELDIFKSFASARQESVLQKTMWTKTTGQIPTTKYYSAEFYSPETFTTVKVSGFTSGYPGINRWGKMTVEVVENLKPTYSSAPTLPVLPKPSSQFPALAGQQSFRGTGFTAGGGQTLLLETPVLATTSAVKTIQLPTTTTALSTAQAFAFKPAFSLSKAFVPVVSLDLSIKQSQAFAFKSVQLQKQTFATKFAFDLDVKQDVGFGKLKSTSSKRKFAPILDFDFAPVLTQTTELAPIQRPGPDKGRRKKGFELPDISLPKFDFVGLGSGKYTPSLGGIFTGKKGQTANLKGFEIRGLPKGWKL